MERMKELISKLNLFSYNYYVLDDPKISDKEYDALYDELIALENESGVVLPNSPSRRVGGEPLSAFSKYTHKHRLYSLDKAQTYESLADWFTRTEKVIGENAMYTLEYKFDGLTINLTYDNGAFVRATTRGNGIVGEDVTEQVLTIKTFPLEIEYKGYLEVGGEGIMYLSTLEKYNRENAVPLKNARNAVAGAIRNLDPKETARREPQIIFYSINYIEDQDVVSSQEKIIQFLKDNKFKVSPYFKILKKDEVEKGLKEIEQMRPTLDFLIDGAVIKVNDFSEREKLGYTEKFPKWAVAFKFEALETTTLLKDVVWQVGRTGKLTPLALLEPVELCGVTVSRATLNNFGDIERKNVKLGDRVFVRRSNDVIPEILGKAEGTENSREIEKITHCPACNAEVVEKGANIFCPNELNCPPQIVGRISHFASKNAMNIDGFSEMTATAFLQALNVRRTYELFEITREQLLTVEGFKAKKADNFLKSIEKSKKMPFDRFIYSLGILNVGVKTSKDLAKSFENIEALEIASMERLTQIDEIGDIVASSIREYFDDAFEAENLENLLKYVTIEYANKENVEGIFSGESFVLTGVLEKYKRGEAQAIIESLGGEVGSTVTKATTIVLYGEDAGSKLEKAKKLNKRLMTEEEFIGLINIAR